MIGYLYNPQCYLHDTGEHLEIFERCERIDALVQEKYNVFPLALHQGGKEDLLRIHKEHYVEWVEHAYENGRRMIVSADTVLSERSYEIALSAATSTKSAIDFFQSGGGRAFLNIRPPGHHAETITGQGFCFFNNIALMAKYAQDAGYEKVLIIDFDVHHGNGTQDTFWEDDTVFYFSSHQGFTYPGTGAEKERGAGKGTGYTANFLMMPESTDAELLDIYENDLPPLVEKFDPDIILVSAGYDLHESDPLAQLNITTEGIKKMVKIILETKNVPFVFFLEGGYDVDALAKNVKVTLEEMMK